MRSLGKNQPMLDRYGRVTRDMRVSLTDRCNLRCTYCMPEEGLAWIANHKILTNEEVIRLVRIAVEFLAIEKVRFTGGEPLLRAGILEIISATADLKTAAGAKPTIGITTNGLSLSKYAEKIRSAGVDRINVSLDTLDPARYHQITHRDRLADVFSGLEVAKNVGFESIKINAVPQPDWYLTDAPALLKYCLTNGFQLRFIEQMPLGPKESWDRNQLVTQENLLATLRDSGFELVDCDDFRGAAPAQLWNVAPTSQTPAGKVGIIASVTHPFCEDCSRTRLTADGMVRSCLFSTTETDLRALVRSSASDEQIAQAWREATWGKPKAHGIDDDSFARPARTMSAIGG